MYLSLTLLTIPKEPLDGLLDSSLDKVRTYYTVTLPLGLIKHVGYKRSVRVRTLSDKQYNKPFNKQKPCLVEYFNKVYNK